MQLSLLFIIIGEKMKHSLLRRYYLENRISKLEQLINEKTVGRGGGDSTPYKVWKYLRDEGPKTRPEIGQHFNSGALKVLPDMEREHCVTKQGNLYSYNPDYNWEDVGVLPRTMAQEIAQGSGAASDIDMPSMDDLVNAMNTSEDEIPQETPTPARRGRQRQERPPRVPRVREVKKNLFSKKFEEVKAAVDAGEDVNQRNDKGQTPLLFACNSRTGGNGDIVAYLVQHGADIAASHKNANSFTLACKNKNDEAVKALLENDTNYTIRTPYQYFMGTGYRLRSYELIALAASRERGNFSTSLHRFYSELLYIGDITVAQYEAIMKTIIENAAGVYDISRYALDNEIREGTVVTSVQFAKKFNYCVMPFPDAISQRNRDKKNLEALFDICKECTNGSLKRYTLNISSFLNIYYTLADALGIKLSSSDYEAMFNNAEFVSKLDDNEVGNVVYESFENKNIAILNALVKNKVRRCPLTKSISIVFKFINNNNNKDLTKTLIKLTSKKLSSNLQYYARDVVGRMNNEYFIEYLIDAGMGDSLYEVCLGSVGLSETDNACVKVLKENGYEFPSNYKDSLDMSLRLKSANKAKSDREYMISKIIKRIKDDEWDRSMEQAVTDDPTLLLEDEVQDAIEKNNTFTSRQLKRKIAALPKDVYDL